MVTELDRVHFFSLGREPLDDRRLNLLWGVSRTLYSCVVWIGDRY
jgi:hypothetical protein